MFPWRDSIVSTPPSPQSPAEKPEGRMPAAGPMIECENLTKRFGQFTAVDHVSFSIAKGSIFGFLGPNGSGKSTVIRMLCGLLQPSEGRAFISGVDVVEDTD